MTTQHYSRSGTSKQINVCFPLLRTHPAVLSSHDVWLLLYNGSSALQNRTLQISLCRSAHAFCILDCVSFFLFCCCFLDSWSSLWFWFALWSCFCARGSFATHSTHIRILGDRPIVLSLSELGIIVVFQAEKALTSSCLEWLFLVFSVSNSLSISCLGLVQNLIGTELSLPLSKLHKPWYLQT